MQTYDAIIIGAGPAGLMAARELAANKANYLIIEARNKIGSPLKCGEITRQDTFLEFFEGTDYPFIKNKISNISFRVKETEKVIKKNMIMLDKPKFLRWLAEPIENNLMLSTKLEGIRQKLDVLQISTGQGTFHAKLAILAYGARYNVQKAFELVKRDIELVPCIGGLFENTTLLQNTAYFFYDEDMGIAAWAFPKENTIFNAGTGIILKSKEKANPNLQRSFRDLMNKFDISLNGKPCFAGNYVTNGSIQQTYSDRLLVCGDAAGQIYAGIGEGIYFALKAGQLAGQTASKAVKKETFNKEFLKEYEVHWKKSFGRQLDAGIILTTILFFLMRHQLVLKALEIIKPKEILNIWFNGKVSVRLKFFYYLLKIFGCKPKR
jgi:digeranylgeranylglycerophospholipid reductase